MGDRGRVPDQLGIPSSGKDPPAEGKTIPTSGEAALADFLHPEVPGWGCSLRAGLQREWDPWDEGGASQGFRCSLAGRFYGRKSGFSLLLTPIYSLTFTLLTPPQKFAVCSQIPTALAELHVHPPGVFILGEKAFPPAS